MSVWQAIQSLIQLLKGLPADVVPGAHVSARRPFAAADLPAVVVAASEVDEVPAGIGRLVGVRRVSETAWSTTTAAKAAGTLAVELWAADGPAMDKLADGVLGLLEGPVDALVAAGFLRLTTRSVGPIEQASLGATPGATALRLPVGCSFVFEAVTPEDVGPDGLIRNVHVEFGEPPETDQEKTFHEVMELP